MSPHSSFKRRTFARYQLLPLTIQSNWLPNEIVKGNNWYLAKVLLKLECKLHNQLHSRQALCLYYRKGKVKLSTKY